MSELDTIHLALAALAGAVALNLKLSFRLLGLLKQHGLDGARADALPLGAPVPAVRGRPLVGRGPWREAPPAGRPTVLLFLSSKCVKCRAKLAEIAALAPLAARAGVELRLVSTEPGWRLRRWLAGSGLDGITLRVGAKPYRRLNPSLASPAYLFVDEHGALQAGGLVGDDDWLSFAAQMRELDADAAA
ncbi:hypothetical protein CSQ96_02630 [Janthinobacterium sp. BJB412]|nr:hypothetical protein CSQ96_02630 [Janthinobacterium sp. BJB412]